MNTVKNLASLVKKNIITVEQIVDPSLRAQVKEELKNA